MNFISNPQLELAFEYVRNTNKNIFLTGKAGTGKTTFLHQIKKEGLKRMVVLAPTGVAAINAGGMTLHSFFQLPFGPQTPGIVREDNRNRRFNATKINLIRTLDLLVIDEISMVRADLLDAVDEVLRRYRDFTKPFGGVQLLMIGDLHQLPPVVKQEEWEMLRQYYQTPYFFGSLALQKTNPVAIELKHIYRQSDSFFIDLLNRVRDNKMDSATLETINSRFILNFHPPEQDNYITLTSHNAVAQDLNLQRLESMPGPTLTFNAKIKGEFPAYSYPTEETLELRLGAQVMFVKNDTSPEKQYFNGKIGKIVRFDDDAILVRCKEDLFDITVSTVTWNNLKYNLNEKTKEVVEESIGEFTQYPLKLAWAITIHKSQGLTFDRAIIDAQAAFAHGQVYVALSRCRSFEGIVLRSKIVHSSVKTDSVVRDYSEETEKKAPTEADLHQSKREYQGALLHELFGFKELKRCFDQLNRMLLENPGALPAKGYDQFKSMADAANTSLYELSDKFLPQLQWYLLQPVLPEANEALQARLQKAGIYFAEKLDHDLMPKTKQIQFVTDNKALLKTLRELLDNLQKEIFTKSACFKVCQNAFITQAYVRAKVDADLDFQKLKNTPRQTLETQTAFGNMPHPELYARLNAWRDVIAHEMDLETYEVLPSRSLHELVLFLPTNLVTLKKIKGFGDTKVKRFGSAVIGIIQQYAFEKNIKTDALPLPFDSVSAAPLHKTDTKLHSFELFKAGNNIDEIALQRSLSRATVEGHLAYFIGKGELDVFSVLEKKKVETITSFFLEKETHSVVEAKMHFGETYSYGEIKMVLQHLLSHPDADGECPPLKISRNPLKFFLNTILKVNTTKLIAVSMSFS